MPSVSGPSDGGYNYYQRNISDLEDELQSEAKKRQTNQEKYIDDLEKRYARDIQKHDADLEETVNNVKQNANRAIASEREYAQNEIDRMKNQTYDKWGRSRGNSADVLQQQLESLQDSSHLQHRKDVSALDDAQETYNQRIQEMNKEHQAELERAVQEAHDSASDTYHSNAENQKQEYDQLKKDAMDNYDRLNEQRMADLNFQRRRADQAINETSKSYQRRMDKMEAADMQRIAKQESAAMDQADRQARANSDSRNEEIRQLHDQINELVADDRRYQREKGQGTVDAINEYENDWRTRERLLNENHEREVGKMKQQSKESERYQSYVLNKNLKDKDLYFSKLITNQALDNREQLKDLEHTYDRDHDQMVLTMKKQQAISEQARENQLADANKQRDIALENQAKQYQGTMKRQRAADMEEIERLQKELNYKATSDDTSVISPAAEAAVRKNVIKEYEKTFDKERERNKGTIDSLERTYSNELKDTIQESQNREAATARQTASERNRERGELLEHIKELEFQKDLTVRNKEAESDRAQENMTHSYANILERQRREYEELLQSTKDDAATKTAAAHQEGEFNLRMAQRAFATRENELIRDYNKRLADQKTELTTTIDEIKAQAQQAIREGERRNKQGLEEQARSYEQRIAQLEYQHKERERYLTENYQDELEKIRRSHELSLQKKG